MQRHSLLAEGRPWCSNVPLPAAQGCKATQQQIPHKAAQQHFEGRQIKLRTSRLPCMCDVEAAPCGM